jgi:hypothetical protein
MDYGYGLCVSFCHALFDSGIVDVHKIAIAFTLLVNHKIQGQSK